MARRPVDEEPRPGSQPWRLLSARVTGTVLRCTSTRRPVPWAEAIAEVRAVTGHPGILAEAAAQELVRSRSPLRGRMVQLLLEAGADPDAVAEYVDEIRDAHGFDLAAFADGINRLGTRPDRR